MQISLQHVSVGCNQGLNTVSKPSGDYVAFAADNLIAIYDTVKCRIVRMLPGHPDRVTALEWINDSFIVSGDSNGMLRIHDTLDWSRSWVVDTQKNGVTALNALQIDSKILIVVAAFSNGDLYHYTFDTVKNQRLTADLFNLTEMMETIHMIPFASDSYLIAMGGVGSTIHIFEQLNCIGTLSGHRGWIQCVSMYQVSSGSVLIASASQDKRVRIWALDLKSEPELQLNETSLNDPRFIVSSKAMLTSHLDWVTGLDWVLNPENKLQLLSCSMDHTMMITERIEGGEWDTVARVGEISKDGLGFQTCIFLRKGLQVLGLAYQGQFQSWKVATKSNWVAEPTISGHFAPVKDIAWDPTKTYFVSVSSDQTARMWAFCPTRLTWHELSRPQIHGYDLTCIAFCSKQPHVYVAGAEEKVLRVFDAPQSVLDRLSGWTLEKSTTKARIAAAYVPELSLTNKTTDEVVATDAKQDLPLPNELGKSLLWPELHKLYGHGYDLLAVASNSTRTLIASACRARNEEYAAIWLWDTSKWEAQAASPVKGHASSVVQLEFSPNDEFLCSVSKDRHFCLYQRQENGSYSLMKRVKAHKRIIWSCSFNSSSTLFATGSRDQTVKLWRIQDLELELELEPFEAAVTAVAFAPDSSDRLAIGLEDGSLYIYENGYRVKAEDGPSRTVHRICWRNATEFITCSQDHSIRLYQLN